jgi:hypothetical protein
MGNERGRTDGQPGTSRPGSQVGKRRRWPRHRMCPQHPVAIYLPYPSGTVEAITDSHGPQSGSSRPAQRAAAQAGTGGGGLTVTGLKADPEFPTTRMDSYGGGGLRRPPDPTS